MPNTSTTPNPQPSDQAVSEANNHQAGQDKPAAAPNDRAAKSSGKKPLILVLIIIFIFTFVGGVLAHSLGMFSFLNLTNRDIEEPAVTPTDQNSILENLVEPGENNSESLFVGKLTKLDQDLQLYKPSETDQNTDIQLTSTYYSAGVYNSGSLQGYTRIVAFREPEGPGDVEVYILATKDFQTYILHDPQNLTKNSAEDDWDNPFHYLDKNKIANTQTLPTYYEETIKLDNTFVLLFKSYAVEYLVNGKDSAGQDIYQLDLLTSLSGFQPLTSPDKNLQLYYRTFEPMLEFEELTPEAVKTQQKIANKYYAGDTTVLALDSTGLPVFYSLSTNQEVAKYKQQLVKFDQQYQVYLQAVQDYDNGLMTEYPDYPEAAEKPTLGFNSSQIQANQNLPWFDKYHAAFGSVCGLDLATKLITVEESELEPVGTVYGLTLYKLKDQNHDLNKLAYAHKFNYYIESLADGHDDFSSMNPGKTIPSYEAYIAQNPLLILKDYWQRWAVVGEYDFVLPGGCGKPVIYLYPTKPTEIEVRLLKPVQFSAVMPNYHQQWKVLAQPNGMLTDLQPELTSCQAIDSNIPGLEYAKQACENNSYPYLYWSGNVLDTNYPKIDQGWVVSRSAVSGFLATKLTEMGLSKTEKTEFLQYWLPQMLAKKANYYRISFLQTHQLNQFIPMEVKPAPDTVFRIFMDYKPLATLPAQLPEPQSLQTLNRQGFTLVEWGGLKQ